ncbi:MAG: ECF-type sigma factor [Steroidobacteraceae bacterium]
MPALLLTDLLQQAQAGDAAALRSIFATTYDELCAMARRRLSVTSRGALLDTTSLVHESFERFANAGQLRIQDRPHFFRYASQTMRSVVVDYVREHLSQRRGGGAERVTLTTCIGNDEDGAEEIMQVHEALDELAKLDQRLAQVVEMRYFAGMTEAEIAAALDIADRTVRRDWEKARLMLLQALT